MRKKLKNRFTISELSGAIGDIGTTLPIAFALVVINGFPPERIFFLWGIIYLVTGLLFKIPLSVQPLKAMSVIAITTGFSSDALASTAFFYGILFAILSLTNAITWLQKWFSSAIIKGIQLGIGLILAYKAINLVYEKGFLLHHTGVSTNIGFLLLVIVIAILWYFQFYKKIQITIVLLIGSIAAISFMGIEVDNNLSGSPFIFTMPDISFLSDAIIYLIIPQIPLTLGNSVFAADDICHSLWKKQAERVTTKRLSLSVGISDLFIGLLGGFPICHGAGGMGAHSQFGAKTGAATIIIGTLFIVVGLVSPLSTLLFLIPIPILSAMLIFDSYRMGAVIRYLSTKHEIIIALTVGIVSFISRNITIALIVGLIIEQVYKYFEKRKLVKEEASSLKTGLRSPDNLNIKLLKKVKETI